MILPWPNIGSKWSQEGHPKKICFGSRSEKKHPRGFCRDREADQFVEGLLHTMTAKLHAVRKTHEERKYEDMAHAT